jgi:hypothetical protein
VWTWPAYRCQNRPNGTSRSLVRQRFGHLRDFSDSFKAKFGERVASDLLSSYHGLRFRALLTEKVTAAHVTLSGRRGTQRADPAPRDLSPYQSEPPPSLSPGPGQGSKEKPSDGTQGS